MILYVLKVIFTFLISIFSIFLFLEFIVGRVRLSQFRSINLSKSYKSNEHLFWLGPNLELSEEQRNAISAHMRDNVLNVVDIVPGTISASSLMFILKLYDPKNFRDNPFADAFSSLHGVALTEDVALRSKTSQSDITSSTSFISLITRLKKVASTSLDLAVLPNWRGEMSFEESDSKIIDTIMHPFTKQFLFFNSCALLLIGFGPLISPFWGIFLLILYHILPYLMLHKSIFKIPNLGIYCLLRWPKDVCTMFKLFIFLIKKPTIANEIDTQKRSWYKEKLSNGVSSLFEVRSDKCPICEEKNLRKFLTSTDLIQCKPGKFILEKCKTCGHIFQNPRPNEMGLEFYCKDFYDGLGEKLSEKILGYSETFFRERAELILPVHKPNRWLDVGTGHGHFCAFASKLWPKAQFDGIDSAESVQDAVNRGWITCGYQGQLSEKVIELSGQYDVVSMFHYLEHSIFPAKEFEMAYQLLTDKGYLIIEIPNPESPAGRFLGQYWGPWLLPQHINFLSKKNIEKLVKNAGFDLVQTKFCNIKDFRSFSCAAGFALKRLSPFSDEPWQFTKPRLHLLREIFAMIIALPLLFIALLADIIAHPYLNIKNNHSFIRILAKKNTSKN